MIAGIYVIMGLIVKGVDYMSEKAKVRKHKLSKNNSLKHVLLVTVLMIFGYYILSQLVLSLFIGIPVLIVCKIDDMNVLTSPLSCIGGLIMLFVFYWWFRPEYKWKPRNTAFAFKAAAPILIYWFVYYVVLFTMAAGYLTLGTEKVTFNSIAFGASAGICEEMAFREVGISYMKRQLRDNKWNLLILLFTSVIFGSVHLTNVIAGSAPLWARMVQVFGTLFFGFFLGAIFLRTGNIWVCILIHTVYDVLPEFFLSRMDADMKSYIWGWMIVGQALLAIWGLYLIRKEKHPEIGALWNDKWNLTEPEEQ